MRAVRALIVAVAVSTLVAGAAAAQREVFGYAGDLGEWEITASVTKNASMPTIEFSGPLVMKHVGICTREGPEERSGEIRFHLSSASSRLNATIMVAGVECRYSAKLADFYSGIMTCKDGQSLQLKLWVK